MVMNKEETKIRKPKMKKTMYFSIFQLKKMLVLSLLKLNYIFYPSNMCQIFKKLHFDVMMKAFK